MTADKRWGAPAAETKYNCLLTPNNQVRLALVGCGRIGRQRAAAHAVRALLRSGGGERESVR